MSDEITVQVEGEPGQDYIAPDEVFQDDTQREQIKTWLTEEFERAEGEREERREQWARWRRQRLARPKNSTVDYPWVGASNIVPPESMSVTNIAFTQVKGKYMNLDPLWKVQVSKPVYDEHARAIEDLLNYVATNEDQMNLRAHNNTIFYDTVSLGTQFGKIVWDRDEVKYKRDGEEVTIVTHDGPSFIPIQLEDFLCRSTVTDLSRAPWYAVKTTYFEHELQSAAQRGFFTTEGVETLLGSPMTELDQNKLEQKEVLGDNPDVGSSMQYEVYEVTVFWDVDEDGVREDIRLWFAPDTGIILREEYNELGFRDVQKFPYLTVPYELYGLGIGWMTDQMQEELTTLHNMAINSGHLNSLQMFATRPGTDLSSQEIKPLAVFESDSPQEDIKLFTFPDMTQSAIRLEEIAKQYIMRATGVNFAMAGLPDQVMKSRFSPTGYNQQAVQGASFLEISSKNFDEAYGQLGKKLFYLLIAHKDRVMEVLYPRLKADDIFLLDEIFSMSEQDIREIFSFSVKITPMDETEEAKQEKIMALTQIYAAYIQQVLSLLMQMNNPQIPPNVKESLGRFVVGLTEMIQDTIDNMSDLSPQMMTPYVEDLKLMISQMDLQKDTQVAEMKEKLRGMDRQSAGAMGAPAGNPANAGMEEIPSGPQAAPGQSTGAQQGGGGAGNAGEIAVFG